jgi:glycosyltransferase involved in cell wall biosynthesis
VKGAPTTGNLSYALVTPARNEEEFIELTLQSVVAQTKAPIRWIIVSDGSTDRTDQIVQKYAQLHPWIELLRLEGGEGRNFARKARAFNTGYEKLRDTPYDIVGNLDADLSFDEEFFAFLLERFVEIPELGVAGAPYPYGGMHYDYRFTDINDVSGCCQLFRRECLEEIGGYLPVDGGGLDWIAVATARMNGWKTRTFVERVAVHHRQMGSAGRRPWEVWFRRGEEDYALGGHPLWQLARSVYQSTSRPYVIGGLLLLSGYTYQLIKREQRPISRELVELHRAEQLRRLKRAAVGLLPWSNRPQNDPSTGGVSISESIRRLERWVETHDYKGYEPFDGLSTYLRQLTFGNRFLEQIVQQFVRQSPVNVRPLLGIKPLESTKGRGYMAWGYLTLLKLTGNEQYRQKAIACLEWLIRNKSPLYADYSWGNHFDYASRAGKYAKHESIIVWTSLIGQAFLDAYESLDEERYLDVAKGICNWIVQLPREKSATGTCLSYLATRQSSIHNANMLGAAMLARTAKHSRTAELFDVARAALMYSCSRQLPDGAWYYGEDSRYHWIDSFHTGYNLDSIQCYIHSTGDQTFRPQMDRGWRYFKQTFFEPSGRPKYYHNRAYPIDIQCAAQGIETLAKFAAHDPEALPTALKVAQWTIRNMQDASGYFYYRRYPLLIARIPMLHWGQATMYRALALLLLKVEDEKRSVGSMLPHA